MESHVSARGVWAIRPGLGFILGWVKIFLFFPFLLSLHPLTAAKLHSWRHEILVCWIVSSLTVLQVQQRDFT